MNVPISVTLALTELRSARGRSRSLVTAVALAAGLVVATSVLGTTMQRQVDQGAAVEYADADLVVRSEQVDASGLDAGASSSASIAIKDVERIAELPGVEATASIVRAHAALAVDDQVRGVLLETLPGAGFTWQGLSDGRFPSAATEIALSRQTLADLELSIGDVVVLGTPTVGRAPVRVVGSVDVRGSLRYASDSYGIVTDPVARVLAGISGVNEVQVRTVPGADVAEVTARINAAAPVGYPVAVADITAATEQLYGTGLSVLSSLLGGFAMLAGLVALVVFSTVVWAGLPGRRRDLALLRAVGATRGQLRASVAIETGLLALLGGLLAVPLGIAGAAAAMPLLGWLPGVPDFSVGLLSLPVTSLVGVPVAALVVGVVAAVLPAYAVGRVSPATALRGVEARPTPGRVRTTATALGVPVTGVLLLAAVQVGELAASAVAAVAFAVAWIVATPLLCRLVARGVLRLVRLRFPVGELAASQLRRFPGRAATTGLAATLAAALLSLSWVVLASLDATTADRAARDSGPELMIGAYAGGAPLVSGTAEEIAGISGVSDVLVFDDASVTLSGRRVEAGVGGVRRTRLSGNITAALATELARVTDDRFPVRQVRDDTAYLPASDLQPFADGAEVTLIGPDGRRQLRLVYVPDLPFQALVAPETLRSVGAAGEPHFAWINLDPGADRQTVLDRVRTVAVLAGGQAVSGSVTGQVRVDQAIDIARGLATAMLAISVLIAVLGAALTVAITVRERSAELAVLRLVGMDGVDVRRMVAIETWIAGALSVATGLVLGGLLACAALVAASGPLDLTPTIDLPVLPIVALGLVQLVTLRLAVTGPLDRVSFISPARSLRAATAGGS